MTRIATYATRAHPNPQRSLIAVAIGDDIKVSVSRGRGLLLEARALLHTLGKASGAGNVDHVQATPELLDALVSRQAHGQLAEVLEHIDKLLAARPQILISGEQPQHLTEQLANDSRAFDPASGDLGGVDAESAAWVSQTGATVVYTDGAANSEEYLGAWAYYVDEDTFAAGPVPYLTTAFAAERYAVAQAVAAFPGPVLIVTDSWDINRGRDVYTAALGLDDPFTEMLATRADDVRFAYIKGHAGYLGNLAADWLATNARDDLLHATTRDQQAHAAHRVRVEELVHATAEHRAQQKQVQEWYRRRSVAIITAEHPGFHDYPKEVRTRIGREVLMRLRAERSAEHADAAADLNEDQLDLLG